MNSIASWRAGAVLVLVGGVLQTAAWLAAGAVPLVGWGGLVGDLLVGLGLIFAGVGIRRRYPACWLLMVSGGAWLLVGLTLLLDAVVVLPREVPAVVLAIVAVTTAAAAIGMIARGRLAPVARWALVLPAIVTIACALLWIGDVPGGSGWIQVAPAAASIVVGIVWLRVRDEPTAVAAQPKVNEYAASPGDSSIESAPSRGDAFDATM